VARLNAHSYLRADETLTALTVEAFGIFRSLGFRSTSHTNGKRLTPRELERLREQWRAIEVIAQNAHRTCHRALTDFDRLHFELPRTKDALAEYARTLGLPPCPPGRIDYTRLKEDVMDELLRRSRDGERLPRPEGT
jgi:hypothetical protein